MQLPLESGGIRGTSSGLSPCGVVSHTLPHKVIYSRSMASLHGFSLCAPESSQTSQLKSLALAQFRCVACPRNIIQVFKPLGIPSLSFHRVHLEVPSRLLEPSSSGLLRHVCLIPYASPFDRDSGQESTFSVPTTSRASGIFELLHCASSRRPIQNYGRHRLIHYPLAS